MLRYFSLLKAGFIETGLKFHPSVISQLAFLLSIFLCVGICKYWPEVAARQMFLYGKPNSVQEIRPQLYGNGANSTFDLSFTFFPSHSFTHNLPAWCCTCTSISKVFRSFLCPFILHSESVLLLPLSALGRVCALWWRQVWMWLHSYRLLRGKLHSPWVLFYCFVFRNFKYLFLIWNPRA